MNPGLAGVHAFLEEDKTMWEKVFYALGLVAMLAFIAPRAMSAMKHSPKAEKGDWQAVIVPLLLIALFIAFLISVV